VSRRFTSADVARLEAKTKAPESQEPSSSQERHFIIPGDPIGKPRQTQRDKWAKRPCVLMYRAWADHARACAGELPANPLSVDCIAYFAFPESYSEKKRAALAGRPHRVRSDWDNVAKAVCDALFEEDSMISDGSCAKRWDDGQGARLEVLITFAD